MPKFSSVHHAYAWSYEILDVWRAGKGFDPDPDNFGSGGTGAMGSITTALDVETIADKHDPGIRAKKGVPVDRSRALFVPYFIAWDEPKNWTENERYLIRKGICAMCKELQDLKWLEGDCAGCRAGKG